MRRTLLGPYSRLAARRATLVALFFQWFIVVTGATVRMTGSGLGCSNWPTCSDARALPELSFHPLVEFLNRFTATPTLLAAAVATWVCWRLAEGPPRRDLRVATVLVLLGILAQAVVGAVVVLFELPPELVAVHFLVSVFLLAAATFAWTATGWPERRRAGGGAVTAVAVAMLALLLAVVVAGVLTTASGPHSGASGTGQHVDRFGVFAEAVTFHARAAYGFAALLVVLTAVRWRRGEGRPALLVLVVASALVAAQIALGEVQYRNGLPWEVVLAHVVNAALLWIVASRAAVDAVFSRA